MTRNEQTVLDLLRRRRMTQMELALATDLNPTRLRSALNNLKREKQIAHEGGKWTVVQ